MDPRVFAKFEEICREYKISGDVLEIGAVPSPASLLNMKSLSGARRKIGLNLDGPSAYEDFEILLGNANEMPMFPANTFDCVLCNAVLEHDRYFWLTVAEIRRVTRPGGLIVLGTPGYGRGCAIGFWTRRPMADQDPGGTRYYPEGRLGALAGRLVAVLYSAAIATPTFAIHNYPGDYYRFSVQAFERVLLHGLENIQVHSLLFPPRIVGAGTKKA